MPFDAQSTGTVSLPELEAHLVTEVLGRAAGFKNELWDTIDSTSTRAAQLAAEGAPEGVLIVARQQTAGRGRLGRSWHSPFDSGVYLSMILRPIAPISSLPLLTIAAGVACATGIFKASNVNIGLKWVNDLVYDGKKVGGILCELPRSPAIIENAFHVSNLPAPLIVGIGINVSLNEADVPDELRTKIDWLERIAGNSVNRNLLVAEIANEFELVYSKMLSGASSDVIERWRRQSVTLGREIIATSGSRTFEGIAVDIAEDGALVVDCAGEGRKNLLAGEITIRQKDGSYC